MRPEYRIYKAFYDAKRQLYFSEIKRFSKMSVSSLQNVLLRMEKQKEILRIKTIGNTYYRLIDAKKTAIIFSLIALDRFNALNPQIRLPLESLVSKSPDVFSILLFGSVSRQKESSQSDIDLLIITHDFPDILGVHMENIRKIFNKLNKDISYSSVHPLSISVINRSKLDSDDYLVEQAIITGFPIKNQQAYYEDYRILEKYGIIGYRDR
ncbi:nucleotidyltransferase domain-containing protein [Candidatus Woesearchaeota archaeon]|nr:nucleotidyltransferase domain-containing protein [Candidatus Woesearchaeota archaeon]